MVENARPPLFLRARASTTLILLAVFLAGSNSSLLFISLCSSLTPLKQYLSTLPPTPSPRRSSRSAWSDLGTAMSGAKSAGSSLASAQA